MTDIQPNAPAVAGGTEGTTEAGAVSPDFDLLAEARCLYGPNCHVWSDGAFRVRTAQLILPMLVAEVERLRAALLARDPTETADELAHRFAVYAFSIDGLSSLDEDSQQVCRDFATWVLRDRSERPALLARDEEKERKARDHDAAMHYVSHRRGVQVAYEDGTFRNLSSRILSLEEVVARETRELFARDDGGLREGEQKMWAVRRPGGSEVCFVGVKRAAEIDAASMRDNFGGDFEVIPVAVRPIRLPNATDTLLARDDGGIRAGEIAAAVAHNSVGGYWRNRVDVPDEWRLGARVAVRLLPDMERERQ